MSTQLVTGEAVSLDLRDAALPSRMLAGGLDAILQLLLFFALFFLFSLAPSGSDAGSAAIVLSIVVLVLLGYPVTFESLLRGRTPGKMALGLRVVRDDGGPIGFRQAFVRGLIGVVVERPGITSFSGAVISMLVSSRGKRLGDVAAGTVVIQERVSARVGPVAQMPPPLASWAATLDLSHLPDDLAQALRSFLARADRMTPAAREDLGSRLSAAVAAVVTPPPPPGTPGWAYLSAVLAERRIRAERALRSARPTAPPPIPSSSAPSYPGAPSTPTEAPQAGPPPSSPPSAGPGGFALPS